MRVGDRIRRRYVRAWAADYWKPGTVVSMADGKFEVKYDDGSYEYLPLDQSTYADKVWE